MRHCSWAAHVLFMCNGDEDGVGREGGGTFTVSFRPSTPRFSPSVIEARSMIGSDAFQV